MNQHYIIIPIWTNIMTGIVCTWVVTENVGFVVEEAAAHLGYLTVFMMERALHIAKIVLYLYLKLALSALVIEAHVIRREHLNANLLAVYPQADRIHTFSKELNTVISPFKIFGAAKGDSTCKLRISRRIEL